MEITNSTLKAWVIVTDTMSLVALVLSLAIAGAGLAWAHAAQRQADSLAHRMNLLEMENDRLQVEAAACLGTLDQLYNRPGFSKRMDGR